MKRPSRPTKWILSAIVVFGIALAAYFFALGGLNRPARSPEKLTIAISASYLGCGLLFIANEKGYLSQEGLEVILQPYTSGALSLQAALGGKADLATAADLPVMFAVMTGQPAAVVASIASRISDQGVIARRDRGIATPADLKGKRVGLTPKSAAHFLLDTTLARYRISPAEVSRRDLQPEDLAAAIENGEVDAVATWNPYLGNLVRLLGTNGVTFFGSGTYLYTFNLVGRQETVGGRPEAMRRLLRALLRAERFADQHPGEAQAIVAKETKIEPSRIAESWKQITLRINLEQSLLALLEDESRWAIRNGYVQRGDVPNYLHFINSDAMSAVAPEALTIIR